MSELDMLGDRVTGPLDGIDGLAYVLVLRRANELAITTNLERLIAVSDTLATALKVVTSAPAAAAAEGRA